MKKKKSNTFLNGERHYKKREKWTSSHTWPGQFKVKYNPFQWAKTSSISSDQCIVYFIIFFLLLINKEFNVISYTNGYTDELVIKTNKWILAFIFHRALGISLQWKTLERTVMRRASDPPCTPTDPHTISEQLTSALRTSLRLLLQTRHFRLDPGLAETTRSHQYTHNICLLHMEEHGRYIPSVLELPQYWQLS